MSAYQTFPDLPAALAAFEAEPKLCRRHVRVDGHVIDLVQARDEAGRAVVESEQVSTPTMALSAEDRAVWDRTVSANVRNALVRLYIGEPAEEVEYARAKPVPEVAAVDLCRACGRPMIGAGT